MDENCGGESSKDWVSNDSVFEVGDSIYYLLDICQL
jgi:hypothetical protein